MSLIEFAEERGLSSSSSDLYFNAVKSYESFCSLFLNDMVVFDDLLKMADDEELSLRWKDRTIRKLLLEYRRWLFENKSYNTAVTYFNKIKTLYRHNEIEIRELPSFKSKQFKTSKKEFTDIPTKDEIKCAYLSCDNLEVRTIILLAATSGLSKIDILNLTVNDFIKSVGLVDDTDIQKKLMALKNDDMIIPVFRGNRQKTGTNYITFTTNEVMKKIITCLEQRFHITKDNLLFTISKNQLDYQLRKVNDKCDFGKVNYGRKFRMHQLRSFHASFLVKNNVFTIEEVDTLQGRCKDKTHRTYFLEDPEKLKEKYLSMVEELTFF